MTEETAPPPTSWADHLRELDNEQIEELAKDYRWLDEESHAGEAREEFRHRREAIIAECERRGVSGLATECRPTPSNQLQK